MKITQISVAVIKYFLDVLLPRRCLYCRSPLAGLDLVFCPNCSAQIKTNKNANHPALFLYAGMMRELILRAKFQPDEGISRSLAHHLERHLSTTTLPISTDKIHVVTYVPSHRRRLLHRGHEFPYLLARAVSRSINKPLCHLLTCTRFDPPLSSSKTALERIKQVEGRYTATHLHSFHEILLLDDVTTTGSTLTAAAQALEKHGYKTHTLAFAATPISSRLTSPLHK